MRLLRAFMPNTREIKLATKRRAGRGIQAVVCGGNRARRNGARLGDKNSIPGSGGSGERRILIGTAPGTRSSQFSRTQWSYFKASAAFR